jgi:hypothetical protein
MISTKSFLNHCKVNTQSRDRSLDNDELVVGHLCNLIHLSSRRTPWIIGCRIPDFSLCIRVALGAAHSPQHKQERAYAYKHALVLCDPQSRLPDGLQAAHDAAISRGGCARKRGDDVGEHKAQRSWTRAAYPLPLLMTLVATCLFALSFIALVRTQVSRQHVALESLISLKSTSGATALDIPASSSTLSLSVALCGFSSHPARFFVTNDTGQDPNSILSNAGGDDTWEIPLNDGQGNWTGFASDGALVVFGATDVPLEVAVSTNGKLYYSLNTGDH